MSKLPIVKPREIINALKRGAFVEVRSKGSHLQLKKGNLLVTIPIHNRDVRTEIFKSLPRFLPH